MIQVLKIEDAVGHSLAHDITEIRPGQFKGPAFERGHILTCRDMDHLRRLGKEHLYVVQPEPDELHENDAALVLAKALCGQGVGWDTPPREGKITLKALQDGILKVDEEALYQFNLLGEVMCATRHTNSLVQTGDQVGGTRAVPLLIARTVVDEAVAAAHLSLGGVLRVLPLQKALAGVMITGNEVYYGRIEDKFEAIIRKKVTDLHGDVLDVVFLPDDDVCIAEAAHQLIDGGATVLITTGGMSVDPDDRTRFGLIQAGACDMVYGAAALPGAMFMTACLRGIPVLGLPACGLFAPVTVFDLIYPRVLAGEKITRSEVARLGHGGMCLNCSVCRFPCCPFGR